MFLVLNCHLVKEVLSKLVSLGLLITAETFIECVLCGARALD
jgi:hypothetical protein